MKERNQKQRFVKEKWNCRGLLQRTEKSPMGKYLAESSTKKLQTETQSKAITERERERAYLADSLKKRNEIFFFLEENPYK